MNSTQQEIDAAVSTNAAIAALAARRLDIGGALGMAANEIAVHQSNIEQAQGTIADYQAQLTQVESAIDVLLGDVAPAEPPAE